MNPPLRLLHRHAALIDLQPLQLTIHFWHVRRLLLLVPCAPSSRRVQR
jgi:hypothetical protein